MTEVVVENIGQVAVSVSQPMLRRLVRFWSPGQVVKVLALSPRSKNEYSPAS